MPVTFDAAENDPISWGRSRWRSSSASSCVEIDVAVGVLVDRDHVGDRLAPRQLVRVVLVGADEDDGPLVGRDLVAEMEAVVEVRRDPQAEDADQLGDRAGRAAAAEEHGVLVGRPDARGDDLAGVLAEPGGLEARAGRLGVGVGVERQDDLARCSPR